MAKYINLDDDPEVYYYMNFGYNEAYIVTPEAERIDLVRCRECKYSRDYKHTKEYVNCEVDSSESIDRDANWYCADGERRENG